MTKILNLQRKMIVFINLCGCDFNTDNQNDVVYTIGPDRFCNFVGKK